MLVMRRIKPFLTIFVLISFFMIVGVQAFAAEGKTYNWKMAQYHAVGTMLDKVSEAFIERLEKASEGRINIRYYPGELLGDYIIQQEAVQSGSLDLAFTYPITKTNPKWDVLALGYVGWSAEQAEDRFKQDGWMFKIVDEVAAECNWKLLAIAPGGSAMGGTTVISNKSYDPLDPKGVKLRVMPAENLVTRYSALGYNPIMMPFSEVSSALALGTIDAAAGCIPQEFSVFGDAFKYAYAGMDDQTVIPFIMNLDLWNTLSEEDQKLVLEAADFTDDPDYGWDAWKEAIEFSYNEELLPWQILVTLDGDGWATLAERARDAEWAYVEKIVGKEIMDVVRANAPELPWGLSLDEMNYGWGKVLTSEWLIERQGAVYNNYPPEVKK